MPLGALRRRRARTVERCPLEQPLRPADLGLINIPGNQNMLKTLAFCGHARRWGWRRRVTTHKRPNGGMFREIRAILRRVQSLRRSESSLVRLRAAAGLGTCAFAANGPRPRHRSRGLVVTDIKARLRFRLVLWILVHARHHRKPDALLFSSLEDTTHGRFHAGAAQRSGVWRL